jgi:hypothetical protein
MTSSQKPKRPAPPKLVSREDAEFAMQVLDGEMALNRELSEAERASLDSLQLLGAHVRAAYRIRTDFDISDQIMASLDRVDGDISGTRVARSTTSSQVAVPFVPRPSQSSQSKGAQPLPSQAPANDHASHVQVTRIRQARIVWGGVAAAFALAASAWLGLGGITRFANSPLAGGRFKPVGDENTTQTEVAKGPALPGTRAVDLATSLSANSGDVEVKSVDAAKGVSVFYLPAELKANASSVVVWLNDD